jgi:PAS domain S-box-containing protein
MSVHVQPLAALPHLRGLLEVTRLVRDERDLTRLLDGIAATISDSLGFRTVAINLYRPAEGDFELTTVHGGEGGREALLGTTNSLEAWAPFFADRFLRRGAYLIPEGEVSYGGVAFHIPELEPNASPDAWHPEAALLVPMRGADGTLLGVVSVDEPESGLLPTDEELDVLVAFAAHVTGAIEAAQVAAAAARDRASLTQLLDVSASLVELDSADDVLQAVARGIMQALEFEKVAVCLVRDGRLQPSGTAGWDEGAAGLDFSFDQGDLDSLFVPKFEIEGCYVIENDVARSLVPDGSTYESKRGGGAGPRAWSRHWLLVPLIERDGSRSGFIWVDDPADSMLPSRERLQALRTFANQATMALRAAVAFETLNARNGELAALHETAFGLLEKLDFDSVLRAIVDNARRLAQTEHAYLYVSDQDTGALRMRVGLGLFEGQVGRIAQPGKGISGQVSLTRETVVVDDYREWADRHVDLDHHSLRTVVGVPLRAAGELVGVIGLARKEPGAFDQDHIALLERFAQIATLALENARLYSALQGSEQLHRRIVEYSTDLIALIDLDGTIAVISPSVLGTLGVPAKEMIGTFFAQRVHPDDADAAAEMFSKAVAGSFASATVRVRHIDGSWVELDANANAIFGPDGQPQHILATGRDVTEGRRLEEQLRQAQKMESIGRLAGGIAHDFNNLLTAIGGYAELILMDLDAGVPPTRDSAEQIARATGRAASLTGQLLAFSRKQVLRPQVIDLNEVVGGMAAMLARMLGEDVVLSTALDPSLGSALADPTQVEQVVLNLALNSRDAMPDGGNLVIRTAPFELREGDDRPHPDLEPGRYVTLAVCDNGIGMVQELVEKAFEPFYTTKGVGEGTGLGLATVHGIVSQSGGVTWVESTPGEGSTFTVCLPLASEREQSAGGE